MAIKSDWMMAIVARTRAHHAGDGAGVLGRVKVRSLGSPLRTLDSPARPLPDALCDGHTEASDGSSGLRMVIEQSAQDVPQQAQSPGAVIGI